MPSYRCDGRVIGSQDGITVSKEALDAFLRVLHMNRNKGRTCLLTILRNGIILV